MTDERYIYNQDIREKKIIGYGAKHKKNGSKSKKCSLPSDFLTRKEKAKLNGECKSWDMKKFYTWDEFKQMPDDIALHYINGLVNRYGIGLRTIESEVFNLSANVLRNYMIRKDLFKFINKGSTGSAGVKAKKRLLSDMEKSSKNEESVVEEMSSKESIVEEMPDDEKVNEPYESSLNKADIQCVSMDLNGFDDGIWNYFKEYFKDQNIIVHISIQTKES